MIPEETSHRPSVRRHLEYAPKAPVLEIGFLAHDRGDADAPVRSFVGSGVADLPQHQRPIMHKHICFGVGSRDGIVGTGAGRPRLNGPIPGELGHSLVGAEGGAVGVGAEIVGQEVGVVGAGVVEGVATFASTVGCDCEGETDG